MRLHDHALCLRVRVRLCLCLRLRLSLRLSLRLLSRALRREHGRLHTLLGKVRRVRLRLSLCLLLLLLGLLLLLLCLGLLLLLMRVRVVECGRGHLAWDRDRDGWRSLGEVRVLQCIRGGNSLRGVKLEEALQEIDGLR